MKNKKPFFSIVIPTYNRCNFLKANISILLKQTFDDYEIVISDNASMDRTDELVKSFKDKRIRYLRNKVDIGYPNNTKQAMLTARGKYIIILGDDDFILLEDTLLQLKKILEKKEYGFARLNILERNLSESSLHKRLMRLDTDREIRKGASAVEILDFFRPLVLGLISGLVFKNEEITPDKFMDCQMFPWFDVAFESARKFGACFLSDYYVVVAVLKPIARKSYLLYDVHNNRLEFEERINRVFELIPKNRVKRYKLRFYRSFIPLLPCVKLYTTNQNLIRFAKRLIQLEPSFAYSPKTWIMLIFSLVIPKSIWLIIRAIQHKIIDRIKGVKNLEVINSRFQYLYNRYYYGFEKK